MSPLRILIIDDHRDCADGLAAVLAPAYDVHVAYSGETGLEMARSFVPDVVLCDLAMPGLDGFTVCRRLRADPLFARCRFVAVSGYGDPATVARARQSGYHQYLLKPADLRLVQALIESDAAQPGLCLAENEEQRRSPGSHIPRQAAATGRVPADSSPRLIEHAVGENPVQSPGGALSLRFPDGALAPTEALRVAIGLAKGGAIASGHQLLREGREKAHAERCPADDRQLWDAVIRWYERFAPPPRDFPSESGLARRPPVESDI